DLSANETFRAAKLTAAEQEQIINQVENSSFDVSDSWETELRVRRISLGQANGLIIRGTRLLCGGTGNCETWVFRQSSEKWLNMFEQQAPIVSALGFEQEASGGIKNLLVSANTSLPQRKEGYYSSLTEKFIDEANAMRFRSMVRPRVSTKYPANDSA